MKFIKENNVGIIQGRLQKPFNGHIQEHRPDWQLEKSLLPILGLSHIEYVVTKNSLISFFVNDKFLGYPISSVCLDNLIDTNVQDKDFLSANLHQALDVCKRNGVHTVTIPLLEDSNMEDDDRRKEFIRNVVDIANLHPTVLFSFECELSLEKITDIVESHPNFYLTYDTGNFTSYGIDHKEFIETHCDKISNVHLKDRKLYEDGSYGTVPLGDGDTSFEEIFGILKKNDYIGPYTMQGARGEDGLEMSTIRKYLKYLNSQYEKSI